MRHYLAHLIPQHHKTDLKPPHLSQDFFRSDLGILCKILQEKKNLFPDFISKFLRLYIFVLQRSIFHRECPLQIVLRKMAPVHQSKCKLNFLSSVPTKACELSSRKVQWLRVQCNFSSVLWSLNSRIINSKSGE